MEDVNLMQVSYAVLVPVDVSVHGGTRPCNADSGCGGARSAPAHPARSARSRTHSAYPVATLYCCSTLDGTARRRMVAVPDVLATTVPHC